MQREARTALLALVLATAGCETQAPERAAATPLDAAPFEALLGSRPVLGSACDGATAARLSGRLGLRLYVSAAVELPRAKAVLRSLPGYFGARGVRFTLDAPPMQIEASTLLARGDVEQAVAPLSAFLARHALPPTNAINAINVVVLPRIAEPGSPAARYFSELEGLSFYPTSEPASAELYALLQLPPRFTRTILLGVEDIARRAPSTVDLTAAHELGHVLGLEHANGNDLMATRPPTCVPALREAQRATLRAVLGKN